MRRRNKLLSRDESVELVKKMKDQGKRIVFTNGCFDILHVGHIELLDRAKSFGDVLILGMNSDVSVRRLKGRDRPVNCQEDRIRVLSALEMVDYIVIFDDDLPCEIISDIEPDVHVKGGDYSPDDYTNMPEAEIIHRYGGEIKIINIISGKSTTNIINKLKSIKSV